MAEEVKVDENSPQASEPFQTPEKPKGHEINEQLPIQEVITIEEDVKVEADMKSKDQNSLQSYSKLDQLTIINEKLISLIKHYQNSDMALKLNSEKGDQTFLINECQTNVQQLEATSSVQQNEDSKDQSPLKNIENENLMAIQTSAMDKFDNFWSEVLK